MCSHQFTIWTLNTSKFQNSSQTWPNIYVLILFFLQHTVLLSSLPLTQYDNPCQHTFSNQVYSQLLFPLACTVINPVYYSLPNSSSNSSKNHSPVIISFLLSLSLITFTLHATECLVTNNTVFFKCIVYFLLSGVLLNKNMYWQKRSSHIQVNIYSTWNIIYSEFPGCQMLP